MKPFRNLPNKETRDTGESDQSSPANGQTEVLAEEKKSVERVTCWQEIGVISPLPTS